MKVLTVHAHHNPRSFCHALLDRFDVGLREGGRGDVDGRLPLLRHRKALILTPTIFDQRAYASGLGDAMTRLVDDMTPLLAKLASPRGGSGLFGRPGEA